MLFCYCGLILCSLPFFEAFEPLGGGGGNTQQGCFYDRREIGGEMGFLNLGQFSGCV